MVVNWVDRTPHTRLVDLFPVRNLAEYVVEKHLFDPKHYLANSLETIWLP